MHSPHKTFILRDAYRRSAKGEKKVQHNVFCYEVAFTYGLSAEAFSS